MERRLEVLSSLVNKQKVRCLTAHVVCLDITSEQDLDSEPSLAEEHQREMCVFAHIVSIFTHAPQSGLHESYTEAGETAVDHNPSDEMSRVGNS